MKSMTFRLMLIVAFASIPSLAQQIQQPTDVPQRPPVVITFVVPVDSNSANMLIHMVTSQAQIGVKDITLVLASPGGDTAAAFAAYNILKTLPINLTTFNVGNIDSAAMLLYCAGKHRYSLPGPGVRFLIHGNSISFGVGMPMDANAMDAQTAQLKSLNQMVVDAISTVAGKKRSDVEAAVHGQVILSPEQAKEWGIVQEIKDNFMTPGATLLSVNNPAEPETNPVQFKSIEPSIGSRTVTN
jgi:ATP-dependent Clp protease protease subunit